MAGASTSDFLHKKQMDYLLKNGSADWKPQNVYVGLLTGTIQIPAQLTGSGLNEVSTSQTGYSRKGVTSWSGAAGDSNLTYSNTDDITFNVPTANWGTITATALFDAETGGNLLYIAELTTPKTVSNGDGAPKILAGQLRISRASCS